MAIPHLPSYTFSNHSRSTFLLSIFVTPRPCSSSSSQSRASSVACEAAASRGRRRTSYPRAHAAEVSPIPLAINEPPSG